VEDAGVPYAEKSQVVRESEGSTDRVGVSMRCGEEDAPMRDQDHSLGPDEEEEDDWDGEDWDDEDNEDEDEDLEYGEWAEDEWDEEEDEDDFDDDDEW
jgi:hypothetical protein